MAASSFSPDLSEETSVQLNTRVGGRRVAALVLDFAFLLIVQLWIYATFGILPPLSLSTISIPPVTPSNPWFTGDWFGELLLMVVYFTVLEGLFGVTVGKLIMGLRVTDMQGQRASLRAVLLRNLLRLIDMLPLIGINFGGDGTFNIPYLVGGIVALCSPYRQRLGDHVAHTLVVDAVSIPLASRSSHAFWQGFIRSGVLALLIVAWLGAFYLFQPPLLIKSAVHIDPSITSYMIGSPTRNADMVTYPLHWRSPAPSGSNLGTFPIQSGLVDDTPYVCNATITFRWSFFIIPGWRISHGEWECVSVGPDRHGIYHSSQGGFQSS
jgi:uncharacterized RDD family membrane protein YckC